MPGRARVGQAWARLVPLQGFYRGFRPAQDLLRVHIRPSEACVTFQRAPMPGSRCSGSVRIAPVMSLGALFLPFAALADGEAAARAADSGHTAWVLVATALVLLVIVPVLIP